VRYDDLARTLDLAVRELLDAGERDLRPAVALSRRARAEAGQAVHRAAAAERGDGFRAEVPIRWTSVVRGWTCTVHGRIDGVEEEDGRTVIEEVKSTALDAARLDRIPAFPEWEAQLAVYVWVAGVLRLPAPVGRLRVVSLLDGCERLVTVPHDPGLGEVLAARLDRLVRAREAWLSWQTRRRGSPTVPAHRAWRPGQEAIEAAVATAVGAGRHLLLTAPTGIGKTAAVMAGVVRAASAHGLGVYWATARTTQQRVVEATSAAMAAGGTPLRSVTLRAREKACLNGVVDCRPEVCRYAAGYHERVEGGVHERLAAIGTPSPDVLAEEARADVLCPYELALDWAARADLVIGDFNQALSPDATVRRLFSADRGWVLVVDEAHQLPERAAEWGSPSLPVALADAVLADPERPGWGALVGLARVIRDEILESELRAREPLSDCLLVELDPPRWADLRDRVDEVGLDHARLRLEDPDADETGDDAWIRLARAVFAFAEALERAGEETVALWTPEGLRLCCRDPSRVLGPRFAALHASVSLSATLAPAWFHRERCGLDATRTDELVVASPFPPENRGVVVVPGVSTTFRRRERDRARVAAVLEEVVAAVPGNVALWFGSYEHLRQLVGACTFPADRELIVQEADATDADRAAVLDRLAAGGPPVVLAAVLGGSFAEGVDLPGGALRAAVVVGPALPPPSTERLLRQAWYEERWDDGFDLAYVVPGMVRVVQAAGRVVRGPEERGMVVLVCERFVRHQFARYLPADWSIHRDRRPGPWVRAFFAREAGAPASGSATIDASLDPS